MAFRDDAEVQEIAKWLPPGQQKIRAKVALSSGEKKRLRNAGFESKSVLHELRQALHLEFRDLGYRTALWDGNA
eukprot:Skav224507  [mRNA]  locus=scaffold3754:98946:99167:- [translate_table: standard]